MQEPPDLSPEFRLFYRFSTNLLPATLTGEGLLDALPLSRFQVKGVLLDFLDDVFLLDPALEAPQRIFDGLTILYPNVSQSIHPQFGLQLICDY